MKEVEIEVLCPVCKAPLEKIEGKHGIFYGCTNWKPKDKTSCGFKCEEADYLLLKHKI